MMETATDPVDRAVEKLAEEQQADVLMLSAGINRGNAAALHHQWTRARRRKRCVLILTTWGGDAHAAYIMARFLRRAYEHLTIVIYGQCKSAGTLLALGGHELVMGVHGELGPLDVQRTKEDDLFSRSSGLDIFQAVSLLINTSVKTFDQHFMRIVEGGGGTITTKTAAEIATNLTAGIIRPLASQIDPMRLGEEHRAVRIANEYGVRLGVRPDVVERLTEGYPSHGFVIDLEEACEFVENLREPSDLELELEAALFQQTNAIYVEAAPPLIVCLTPDDPARSQGELFHAAAEQPDGTPDSRESDRPDQEDGGIAPESPGGNGAAGEASIQQQP